MSIDDDLDRLLQGAFDQARPRGHEDIRGLREGAVVRAGRIRRRRRIGTGVVSALATAGLVAGVASAAGGGWLGQEARSTSLLPSGDGHWASLAKGAAGQAYSFPGEVSASATPTGMSLVPRENVVGAGSKEDDDPLRLAGSCPAPRTPDTARQSVASARWNYAPASDPGGSKRAGELGLAGFTTGTGPEAFHDFVNGRGPCLNRGDLQVATWDGPGDDGALFIPNPGAAGTAQFALASVLVGDVIVFGSSLAPSAQVASAEATSIATKAATQLVELAYPPAMGQVLGTSTRVPNPASASGAPERPALGTENAYDFGDVFPDESSMPAGFVYQGEALEGTNAAPVMGVHACDPGTVDDTTGMDEAPHAVAEVSRMAYTGKGLGGDSALHVTVSGWASGTGAAMFAALQNDKMTCRFGGPYDRLPWAGRESDSTWLSKHTNGAGLVQYLAAQRVGDVIVAVVMDEAGDGKAAIQTAIRLSDEAATKVKASNLPAAKGH